MIKKIGLLSILFIFILSPHALLAMSVNDLNSFNNNTKYYEPDACDSNGGAMSISGDIQREEDGDVYVNKGKCSPNNLGPHNSKYGDNVFRWRLEKKREQVLDHNTGIQEPTASTTTTTP